MVDSNSFININTTHGFLSASPLIWLPPTNTLNQQLNSIALQLPNLIKNNQIHQKIDELNLEYQHEDISLENNTEAEKNSACLILLFIAQAYIWTHHDKPKTHLPSVIARNLYSLCREMQRLPTFTYADYVLNNWHVSDSEMNPCLTFTGEPDEAWFIKIHIMIEAACGKALRAAYDAVEISHSFQDQKDQLIVLINTISTSINEATNYLNKMEDGCDPFFYLNKMRYFLSGWEKVSTEGVLFEGVLIRNKNPSFALKGATGAQSSILPALDAALGIQHDMDYLHQMMYQFQQYMPRKDVFLIHLFGQSKIKEVVKRLKSKELLETWEHALQQIGLFRGTHMQLVKHYIYQPAEHGGIDRSKIVGTGGTAIEDYLHTRYEKSIHTEAKH